LKYIEEVKVKERKARERTRNVKIGDKEIIRRPDTTHNGKTSAPVEREISKLI